MVSQDYKKNKVKKVSIYNRKDYLMYTAEVDTNGNLWGIKTRGARFFVSYRTIEISKQHVIQERAYYKNDLLMRMDSIVNKVCVYEEGDSMLVYHEKRMISYWRGSLINEKNEYLNATYLGQIVQPERSPLDEPEEEDSHVDTTMLYFTEAKRTDYTDQLLYTYKSYVQHSLESNLIAGERVPWDKIKDHSFYKVYRPEFFEDCPVDGACFEEPVHFSEAMWCGSADYDRAHAQDGHSYRYAFLENGLYNTYILDYYPIDPNPAPPSEQENKLDLDLEEMGPQRLSTPESSVLYTYRYVYY